MSPHEHEVFVVADAHGRLDLIEGLLVHAGAERAPGRTIVHLGDLTNCVQASVDDDLEKSSAPHPTSALPDQHRPSRERVGRLRHIIECELQAVADPWAPCEWVDPLPERGRLLIAGEVVEYTGTPA